ncbi:MAG: hypothetical protein JNL11_01330 [Bdellovibrionaceae bacterium]|nr:hypothetical protein [Pseudobdellovibrionaceae bacterium]
MPHKLLFKTIVILVSFCGISYQFLINRVLIQFSQNEILNQSVTLGFYLLAMGIGAAAADRVFKNKNAQTVYLLEIGISILGMVLVPLIYSLHIFINIFIANKTLGLFYGPQAVFTMQIFTVIVGLITGFELPLLMSIGQNSVRFKASNASILAFSYFGSLAGALYSAGIFLPSLDFLSQGVLIGLMTLLAATLVAVMAIDQIKKIYCLLVLIPIALSSFVIQVTPKLEQLFLKNYYMNMKVFEISPNSFETVLKFFSTVDDVERYMTPYQVVDITPRDFMTRSGKNSNFIFFLNNQVQFGGDEYLRYHETMVHGAINLTGKIPKNVLVLGGGDGLILTELRRVLGVESIIQVELDPHIIELATYHPIFKAINQSVYQDGKAKVYYQDAFSYIRKTQEKFDAVFIDFPFPTSYDLSKLYSVEFYRSLRKVLNDDAYFVFDAPVFDKTEYRPKPKDIFASTLRASGFQNISAFGLAESFYIVSLGKKSLQFDYDRLPPWMSNQTIINLAVLNESLDEAEVSEAYVNSIFKPQKFVFK